MFHERSEAELCETSFFSAIWDKEVHGGPDLAENPQFSPDEFDNEYTSSVVTFSAQIWRKHQNIFPGHRQFNYWYFSNVYVEHV